MWERCLVSQPCHFGCLVQEIDCVESFRIFLEKIDLVHWRSIILISSTETRCLWYVHLGLSWQLLNDWANWSCLDDLLLLTFWWIQWSFISFVAFTLSCMRVHLFEREYLFAFIRALESQVLEDISQNFVHLIHCCHFVANSTLEFTLCNIAFSRSLSEISQTFSATTLEAISTLDHVFFNHETQWTLIITLWKTFNKVCWVKIMFG